MSVPPSRTFSDSAKLIFFLYFLFIATRALNKIKERQSSGLIHSFDILLSLSKEVGIWKDPDRHGPYPSTAYIHMGGLRIGLSRWYKGELGVAL